MRTISQMLKGINTRAVYAVNNYIKKKVSDKAGGG
jgi:hypothetical protein